MRALKREGALIVSTKNKMFGTLVVFSDAVMPGAVLGRLASPGCLCLCLDGVYKVLKEDAVLISLGILLKSSNSHPHATSYQEMLLGLFASESQLSYQSMFECFASAAQLLCGIDILSATVLQVHGDQAEGLEAARAAMLPLSRRRSSRGLDVGGLVAFFWQRPVAGCSGVCLLGWVKVASSVFPW